mmetsp:Transcript_95120/g.188435  ORF Transcript_95120/g.188435 Transcript_95120/m.188435 type:complete len:130 (-) Transcript_95120:56-445(-)|eukprot:CAMPEP_0172706006 /NCGR_PEP_ID=MMETSP1074-20121228/45735_1 /TAXON_ID=2916 /ORGANISM="Ceratium fusus, Strain PA161109" /LENGTH=129 /DNA_ID=CAMNT_0013528505 /DNA_START=79 /DNA_END=468 /DNA_ORIENTATION=-
MSWAGNAKGVWQPQWQKQGAWIKGGGWGKGDWGGKGKLQNRHRTFRAEQKVWIGGLAEGVSYKELFELVKPAGAKWAEVFSGNGKGTGVACFASAEDATAAIAELNGQTLGGAPIQADVWEKKKTPEAV